MKRPLILITCTLFAAPFFGNAAPTPGCADLTPPGTWSSYLSDMGSRSFELGDGLTYALWSIGLRQAWTDSTGQWDWILQYGPAHLSLGISAAETPGTTSLTIRGSFGGVPGVELSWNSHTNRLYQFQSCADLSASDWTDLGSPIRGTGTRQSACEPISTGTASRFYRLLEFP